MKIISETVCIASTDPPTLWSTYGSLVEAKRHLKEANASDLQGGPPAYRIMRHGEYENAVRAFYVPSLRQQKRAGS